MFIFSVFWLCFASILPLLIDSYEIKCSHGFKKRSLSCIFNYVSENRTLSDDMPSDFRPFAKHISHLTLGISNLTTLPNDTFKMLPGLRSLTARADIQTLSRQQFLNATKLMILNFGYNNRIEKLESRLFKFAPSLEYLDLGFNQISIIEDKAFRGLVNLKTLFLEANAIAAIKNKTLSGIRNLQRLDMSRNAISDIETGSFAHMSKLKSLHLNQNRISRLRAGIFSGFRAIERIDLSINLIDTIDSGVFDDLTTLDILELGFNRLTQIPDGLEHGTPNLGSLFLASNQISALDFSLYNLTQLTVLDFSFNPLFNISGDLFSNLNGLESLELRGCNLTELDEDIFWNKFALEALDLSENNLTTIDLNVFRPLENLRFLKLQANRISEMANFTEIKDIMPNLEFINLSRNEIDCDTIHEMVDYFRNNTIEFELGEEVDVGCQLIPVRSRLIQAYQLSNARFNDEAVRLINWKF